MWEINAQPTMFSRKLLDSFLDPPHDFSLDLYAYYLAIKKKYKIIRFNVKFGQRIHGKSNYGFSRIIYVLLDLLYIKLFKNYKTKSIYMFGTFSFLSFLLSFVVFLLLISSIAFNISTEAFAARKVCCLDSLSPKIAKIASPI